MEMQLATFGVWEILIILAIVIVIFGASRLPKLGDGLGKSIRNFRRSISGQTGGKKVEQLPPGKLAPEGKPYDCAEEPANHSNQV
jgi:sec-independent protein translocase protein TatA